MSLVLSSEIPTVAASSLTRRGSYSMTVEVPELDTSLIQNEQPDIEGAADDIVQDLYSQARTSIEEKLDVVIEIPDRHNVVFKREGFEIHLQYRKGEEITYGKIEEEGETGRSLTEEEEFIDQATEQTLFRLKKAIALYSKISEAQSKLISGETIQARYA